MPKVTNKKKFSGVEDDTNNNHEEEEDDDDESSMGPKKMITTTTTTTERVPATSTTTTTGGVTAASVLNHNNSNNMEDSYYFEREMNEASNVMDRIFSSCSDDPKGSVHRAWGISLLFVIVYFTLSIVESKLLLSIMFVVVSLFFVMPCFYSILHFTDTHTHFFLFVVIYFESLLSLFVRFFASTSSYESFLKI